MDIENSEELFNLRDWLESVLEKSGAKVEAKGLGMGGADLWFKLEGMEYFISCKPVIKGQEHGMD